jgi:hypothetical protein
VSSFSAVSLTPAKNFRLFGYFPVTRINADTGDKFFAGVVDTADQFIAGVVIACVIANISANFRKNSKQPQWNTWGPRGH